MRILREKIRPHAQRVSISFFRGEPTVNMPLIRDVVSYVKALQVPHRFVINTNGCIVPADLDYLIANDFVFSVSSDGLPEVTDAHRRNTGSVRVSKCVVRTIRQLVQARVVFQVRATTTAENMWSLNRAVRYWCDRGIDSRRQATGRAGSSRFKAGARGRSSARRLWP